MKKSLKWLFATLFILCLLVAGMSISASAAELPGEDAAEPFVFPQWTPTYIAMQHNGSFLAPNLSISSTLSAYRYNDTRSMYWVFRSVGTVNGQAMFTIHPSSNSSYALTVNPSTREVTLQPHQTNNNLQYWYHDDQPLTGEYIVSGAATTTAYQKRLVVSTYADSAYASVTSSTSQAGTLFAFFSVYTAPTMDNEFSDTCLVSDDYVIDTDALYQSGTRPVTGASKSAYLWCTYSMYDDFDTNGNATVDSNGVVDTISQGIVKIKVTDKISGVSCIITLTIQ